LSLSYKNQLDYANADLNISKAIVLNPKEIKLQKEKKRINRLKKIDKDKIEDYKEDSKTSRNFNDYPKKTESEAYNILLIDHSVASGVIPALLLCELEKRTNKPIAALFNMISQIHLEH
jgi:hypothetical protein